MVAIVPMLGIIDWLRWDAWVALAAGLLFAGLVVIVCLSPFFRESPGAAAGTKSMFDAIHTFFRERRRGRRQKRHAVRVDVADAETQASLCEGEVLDHSLEGVRLSVPRTFAVGAVLRLRKVADSGSSPRVLVRVTHANPSASKRWVLGCEITQPSAGSAGLLFS